MPRISTRLFVAMFGLGIVVVGCGSDGSDATVTSSSVEVDGSQRIVVLGDSIMEWNSDEGASIPDVMARVIGAEVVNGAEGGAMAAEIPGQFDEVGGAQPSWVVFDGGGNDLNDRCGCGQCAAVHDELLTSDGADGALFDFTERMVDAGSRVVVVGYYEIPSDAEFGFAECADDLADHNDRLATLADRFDEVIFVDPSDVVRASMIEAYDEDRVHPSIEGSRMVGTQIAEAILSAG